MNVRCGSYRWRGRSLPKAELLLCRPVLLLLAVLHWPHDNRPIVMNSRRGQRALLQAMGLPPKRSAFTLLDRLRD